MTRLDIGCGRTWREGFEGVDCYDFGQQHVLDVRGGLPFADDSVEEARAEHFIEHLTRDEAIAFLNDVWRVLKPGAMFHVVVPHGLHPKAYVLTHRSFWTVETFRDLAREDRWEVYGIRVWRVGNVVLNKRNNIHAMLFKPGD